MITLLLSWVVLRFEISDRIVDANPIRLLVEVVELLFNIPVILFIAVLSWLSLKLLKFSLLK